MEIPTNQWLPTAFNAAVPSGVPLLTVAGDEKEAPQTFFLPSHNLIMDQEAKMPMTKNIFDMNEQSEPILIKANVFADVEALIVDVPDKPVEGVPADIQIQNLSIPYFSDFTEQKNDPLTDPQDGKSGKKNPTYQGFASPLEKPIEIQNTLYTNTLFASNKSPLMVMSNDKIAKGEPLEIDLLNTIQKGNNKDAPPSPAASAPNEQKPNLSFPLPKAVEVPSETNNKLSLLNQLQQEIHTSGPKITAKGITNQNVVTGNDTVKAANATGNEVNDKTKSPQTTIPPLDMNNIKPQNTTLPSHPVDKQTVMLQDIPTEHTSTKEHTKTVEAINPDGIKSKTQPALGMRDLESPDINPTDRRDPAPVKYRSIGTLSTSEIIIEEITHQRATTSKNNTTPQGLVNPLVKPIEIQNTLYTNTLFASDKSPLIVMSNAKTIKVEPLEIDLLSTIQKGNNKDAQPSSTASAPNEQKPNLSFPLPKAVEIASETNNKLSLLNQLQREIHNTEPKITTKYIPHQNVVTGNDTVKVTDAAGNEVSDKTKSPQTTIPPLDMNNIKPQNTTLPSQPVDKQTVMLQDIPTEHTSPKEQTKNIQSEKPEIQLKVNESNMKSSDPAYSETNPLWRVARQNPVTQPMDSRILTNTQTEGQTGTESGSSSQHEDPKQTETAPAESEGITNSQDLPSSNQETKVVDLSLLKAETTPDEQHNNLSTNLVTNEQNNRITASSPEGFGSQSVKDAPKSNNPQQIPESYYNKIIEQIAQKIQAYPREGRWEANLRLDPPELGQIKLKFSVTGNRLEASIEVKNLNVMHAIERDVPRLREAISEAGIDVGKLDVLCQEEGKGRHRPYFTQHTNHETQNPSEEDTDIETVEKADKGSAMIGINRALNIDRIDYIV